MNTFKLDIPFYNAGAYIERCLLSVLTQRYDDYHIVLTNDASTDNSDEVIRDIIKDFPDRITYIKNETRMGAMFNHQRVAFDYCELDDIVIHLDGDDWLSDKKVLKYIDEFYAKNDCWLMYGQYKFFSGREGTSKPYPTKEIFENKRNSDFVVSHIRTFKGFVFHEIKNQDPELKCFKNNNGEWYPMTCDVAMMYPLMEICSFDKVSFNEKVLYIYNDSNPISDVKVNMRLQLNINHEINSKPKFKKIEHE